MVAADPSYGIMSWSRGRDGAGQAATSFSLRSEVGFAAASPDDFDKPNGLHLLGPGAKNEYSGPPTRPAPTSPENPPPHPPTFKSQARTKRKKGGKAQFGLLKQAFPTGFRVDTDGNVWTWPAPALEPDVFRERASLYH